MTEEEKPTTKPAPKQNGPHFIPKLKGKKVVIRLVSGGQPVTGTIEGCNPYEILIQTAKGQLLNMPLPLLRSWVSQKDSR